MDWIHNIHACKHRLFLVAIFQCALYHINNLLMKIVVNYIAVNIIGRIE